MKRLFHGRSSCAPGGCAAREMMKREGDPLESLASSGNFSHSGHTSCRALVGFSTFIAFVPGLTPAKIAGLHAAMLVLAFSFVAASLLSFRFSILPSG